MGKKKPYPKAVPEPKQVSEPIASYKNAKVISFTSFEEMNEFDIKEMAESSARKRFENITYLIQKRFASELKKPFSDFTLHFE